MVSILICCVFLSLLGQFGSGALQIVIDPQISYVTHHNNVTIACLLDDAPNSDVQLIEIKRDAYTVMAFIKACSNVSEGLPDPKRDVTPVEGRINDQNGNSFLKITLPNPMSQDSGIYSCHVTYVDKYGRQSEESQSLRLSVNALDPYHLETVIYELKNKISDLESKLTGEQECKPCAETPKSLTRMNKLEEDYAMQSQQITNMTLDFSQQINRLGKSDDFLSAFLVSNDEHLPIEKGKTVVFPVVVMQKGQGYDPSTGIYTAPRSGLYVFHLSAGTPNTNCWLYLKLWANEVMFAQLGALGRGTFDRNSISAPIELTAGDEVKVITDNHTCGSVEKYRESLFGGYCVKAYATGPDTTTS